VFDTQYSVSIQQLQPGDKVLLYTDGIDTAAYEDTDPGVQSLVAYATRCREKPIDELMRLLSTELFRLARQTDDLTVLGLEILEQAGH
jgi:serine phosphatase RsbU (regulator of sigma subunit)